MGSFCSTKRTENTYSHKKFAKLTHPMIVQIVCVPWNTCKTNPTVYQSIYLWSICTMSCNSGGWVAWLHWWFVGGVFGGDLPPPSLRYLLLLFIEQSILLKVCFLHPHSFMIVAPVLIKIINGWVHPQILFENLELMLHVDVWSSKFTGLSRRSRITILD